MKRDHTELVFVVDRSGSMVSIRSAMEEGYATLIAEQRKVNGTCDVSVYQFDHDYQPLIEGCPIDSGSVSNLSIVPRGNTALYDAVGRTINSVGERLAKLPEKRRPSKVIMCIITDGHENASKEFSHGDIRAKIEHQKAKYNWDFVFLGGEFGAVEVAKSLAIKTSAHFEPTKRGTEALWQSTSGAIARSRMGGGAALDYDQAAYNAALNGS